MLRGFNLCTVKSLDQHFRKLGVETCSNLSEKWGRPEAKAMAVEKDRIQRVRKILRVEYTEEVTKWIRAEMPSKF